MGRRSRRGAVLAAGLLAGGVLAGCGQGGGIQEAAAPDPAVDPAAATSAPAVDLAEGLLPASAFAPGATVLPLTEELLRSSGLPAGGVPPGTELDLGDCAALLTQLQAAAAAGVDAAAGQAVLEGAQATVQGLVAGSAAGDAVATVTGALEGCRTASASVPEHGAATVTVGEVRRPDLGDAAVEVAATVDATAPDGRQVTAPVLVAFVQDGDRVMSLATTVLEGGALDEQAFAGRLAEAYRVQDEALG
ncbi:hypothetical protein SAMN06893097_103360 [Geodermatophilus sabuli]|uniref:Lipoprotein n=1 Tax=Geodermatophilus sabuli TaxID=1564158 RepID=A0A285EDR7_9ACTN|nr:hypothetical protein SAMN06893097_103360 [Geodermatophilus sabuli]